MSRIVIPPAYKLMIIPSIPSRRRWPFATSIGVNVPCRSRGTASSISPISVATVLLLVPLRELSNNDAVASPRS